MATPAEIAAYRQANAGLVALMERDLNAFWASLNLARPERVRDALLEFVPFLTAQYGEIAAAIAADWFDQLRIQAAQDGLFRMVGAAARFRSVLAPVTPADVMQRQVRFGAQHLFTDDPEQTLVFLRGETQKYVLQPGRDTITQNSARDRVAKGWRRVVRAGGCDWCHKLSSRGAVFKESTVAFDAHHDCNCTGVPTW